MAYRFVGRMNLESFWAFIISWIISIVDEFPGDSPPYIFYIVYISYKSFVSYYKKYQTLLYPKKEKEAF